MDEINKILIELQEFKEDLLRGKQDILREVKLSKEEIEDVVREALPKDHDTQHVELQRFLDHSPEARIHGEHHSFTESVRSKIEHTIVAIFKGLGAIILISLAVGLYSWVKHQAGSL